MQTAVSKIDINQRFDFVPHGSDSVHGLNYVHYWISCAFIGTSSAVKLSRSIGFFSLDYLFLGSMG